MISIDFLQVKEKRKKAFVDDKLLRIVFNQVFPSLKDISNDDIHVLNYVRFRSKRLLDIVVRYKNIIIPIALDFSIESDESSRTIRSFRALYKFKISIDKGEFESILFNIDTIKDFDVDTFKEFLGDDGERFNILYDNYYNYNSPMQMKQHVMKIKNVDGRIKTDIAFDVDFHYMNETSGFFFNIYSNELDLGANDREKIRVEELSYQLKPMDGVISGKFNQIDFWATIKDDPSMIAEPFRLAIQKHYNVDEYVIPHFDSHIELFNFYNQEQTRIKEISEMIKI